MINLGNTIYKYFFSNGYLKPNVVFTHVGITAQILPVIITAQIERKKYSCQINIKALDESTLPYYTNKELIQFLIEIINYIVDNVDDIHRDCNFIFLYESDYQDIKYYYIYDHIKNAIKLLK